MFDGRIKAAAISFKAAPKSRHVCNSCSLATTAKLRRKHFLTGFISRIKLRFDTGIFFGETNRKTGAFVKRIIRLFFVALHSVAARPHEKNCRLISLIELMCAESKEQLGLLYKSKRKKRVQGTSLRAEQANLQDSCGKIAKRLRNKKSRKLRGINNL